MTRARVFRSICLWLQALGWMPRNCPPHPPGSPRGCPGSRPAGHPVIRPADNPRRDLPGNTDCHPAVYPEKNAQSRSADSRDRCSVGHSAHCPGNRSGASPESNLPSNGTSSPGSCRGSCRGRCRGTCGDPIPNRFPGASKACRRVPQTREFGFRPSGQQVVESRRQTGVRRQDRADAG